ncbi:MAG: insulinase family protein [Bacteroidetes bacterium]|nr:insulinase family protein [Bacteroidota bacterium]
MITTRHRRTALKPRKVTGRPQVNVRFRQFRLDNGLTAILRKDDSVPVVAVDVCYHVGSKNEKSGKTGFAHLFEHLMFEGSEHVGKGEFDRYISLAGGYNNAYTTEDLTNYYEVLPSNQLPLALWLESDRMLKFSVTEEAFSTQREVVKEEKRWRVDNRPYGDISEKLQGLIFPVGQYHWPVIGSMEDLNAAGMNDVKEFYESHYTPDNAVLVISGSIDEAETETLVRRYFSDIPSGAKPRPKVAFEDKALDREIRETLRGNVPAPAVFAAYKMPAEGSDEYYELSQAAKILSDGNSSRLYKRLLYNIQAVSEFDVSVEGMEKAGVFLFSAFIAPGHSIDEVLSIFDEEIDRLKKSLVTPYEFEKAQNSTLSSYIGRLSTNSGITDALGHYHAIFNDPGMINSEVERELSVTRESVRRAAGEMLDERKRVVVSYIPSDGK